MVHHFSQGTHSKPKLVSRLAGIAVIGLLTTSLSACGSESVPTCAQFAGMHPDTGLLTQFTSEQSSALRASLRSAGFDDGALNSAIGSAKVLAYCNIYGGVANSNQDQPISNAH